MILVTGGAGYIGSHVVKKLLEVKQEVIVFDNFENTSRSNIEKLGVKFLKGDLRFREDLNVLKDIKIDTCIHLAAYASVGDSVKNPFAYYNNNVLGTLNLLDFLSSTPCTELIFSSTSEVYGESDYLPIDEAHKKNPLNPYGHSKLIAEELIKSYEQTHGIKHVLFRYFNAAGSSMDGSIGEIHTPETHLIPNIIFGVLGLKDFTLTCSKVDTPDGTPVRDYVHVDDIADAHVMAIDYLKNNPSDEFNLGSGKGYSVLEIVNQVESITGVNINKTLGEIRVGEPGKKYASYNKIKNLIGWTPRLSLEDIITSAYRYYRENKKLIKI